MTHAAHPVLDTLGHYGLLGEVARPDMEDWLGRHFDEAMEKSAFRMRMDEMAAAMEPADMRPDDPLMFSRQSQCGVCGVRFAILPDGPGRYVASDPCTYPGGIPDYDVVLSIPSGRIAFANDLRELFVIDVPESDCGTRGGIRDLTLAYAGGGMAHFYVGNTSPSVWRQDGRLAVANYRDPGGEDEDEDFEAPTPGDMALVTPVAERGAELCFIDTELWWVSAMDHDAFLEACAAKGREPGEFGVTVVDVEPGNHAFTIRAVTGRDTPTETYATVARTEAPAIPIVRVDETLSPTLAGSQAWKVLTQLWGRYEHIDNGYQGVESLLVSTGNGYDWTNGFLRMGSRVEDAPFATLGPGSPERHPLEDGLPRWDYRPGLSLGLPRKGMRPMSPEYAALTTMPANVDPWWLAMGILFAASTKDDASNFFSQGGYVPEEGQRLMRQALALMLSLVESRGGMGFIRPYLSAWADPSLSLDAPEPPDVVAA